MVEREICAKLSQIKTGISVRIYGDPTGGWRMLFGQEEGAIEAYTTYDNAMGACRL